VKLKEINKIFIEGMKGVTVLLAMLGIREMMELMVTRVLQVRYCTGYLLVFVPYSSYIYSAVSTVYLDFHVFPWPRFMLPFPDLKNKLYCVTKFF
jgi:hypothetical protein